MSVGASLLAVREQIEVTARAVGRAPESVRLIAVSKFHAAGAIREAYACGQRDFGENYVQELAEKARALADLTDLRWHFIGHLQRNKVKQVVAVGASIQSVDSERLIQSVASATASSGAPPTGIYIQVNVAGEAQKSGCTTHNVASLVAVARGLPSVELQGLMTIPPAGLAEAGTRRVYRELAALAAKNDLAGLSMGMTDDLEFAIAEGATVVRVGTAIFGPRSAA